MRSLFRFNYLNLLLLLAISSSSLFSSHNAVPELRIETTQDLLRENIALMASPPAKSQGMDIIIISASSKTLTAFWEDRLAKQPISPACRCPHYLRG